MEEDLIDSIDLDILTFMKERTNWEAYKDHVTKGLCTKESWTLVGDIGRYYNDNPTVTKIDDDFKMWFRVTGHPAWKSEEHQIYGLIVDNVLSRPQPNRSTFLKELDKLRFTSVVGNEYSKLRQGDQDPEDFMSTLEALADAGSSSSPGSVQLYDLETIAQYQRDNKGLYWRLEDLNKSIGPVRKGDFTIVGKRPEVGGTSFLASEMSYMLEQMDDDANAIIFSNEEEPTKIYTRMMSSALDVDYRTMMTAPGVHKTLFQNWLGTKTWELKHDTAMTLGSIKAKLKERDYGLIGINVLLKVGGTDAKEDHDKFQALGEEMRKLAQEHGPVIAIVQADPSAENTRYIAQDKIYKSKTALQGEADILIMIGMHEDSPIDSRFIHVAKNKIPPAPCTDPAVKHIKSEVKFDIGTGRFTSANFKGNSKP